MLGHIVRTHAPRAVQRRTFVSTVLLTRNWETETVGTLKAEARKRGLLMSGTKATLVGRLQEHDRQQQLETPPPVVQQQVRHVASTTEVPGVPSTSQPSPIPPNFPKEFLDVKIPDLSQRAPEAPIQVPFVPDLWDSSKIKAQDAPAKPPPAETPKVLAVAGAATHPGGGPSHNLYPPSSLSSSEIQPTASSTDDSHSSGKDETEGAWTLVGILFGSWLVAGFLKPKSAYSEKGDKSVSEKAAEQL